MIGEEDGRKHQVDLRSGGGLDERPSLRELLLDVGFAIVRRPRLGHAEGAGRARERADERLGVGEISRDELDTAAAERGRLAWIADKRAHLEAAAAQEGLDDGAPLVARRAADHDEGVGHGRILI